LPAIFSAAMGFSGCAHQQARSAQAPDKSAAKAAAEAPVAVPASDVDEASLHIVAEVKTVHFDYDSAFLGPEARAILVENANWLKFHVDARVQEAGHCDERGTVGYNLALGQRRAQGVKDYYKSLGIDEGRVQTISYGNEKPLCRESSEECWQQNRRVETLVAFPKTVSQLPTGAVSR
jgi:peptidoglycan-associated lipoprotein